MLFYNNTSTITMLTSIQLKRPSLSLQGAAGREWYIHTIYTVRSKSNANRGLGKRSLEYHSVSQSGGLVPADRSRSRRSAVDLPEGVDQIGVDNNRGTNILHIALDRTRSGSVRGPAANALVPQELSGQGGERGLVTAVGVLVGLLLTVLVAVILVLLLRSRQRKKGEEVGPKRPSRREPMVTRGVECSDSSEV